MELLIEQPKNDKLESAIPNETKVNKAELKNDIVYLDLSKEFIEKHIFLISSYFFRRYTNCLLI